jgi:hypothetical protein
VTSGAQHTPRGTTWRGSKLLVLWGFLGRASWHAPCCIELRARSHVAFVASLSPAGGWFFRVVALGRVCRGICVIVLVAVMRGGVGQRLGLRLRFCVRNRRYLVGVHRDWGHRRNFEWSGGWLGVRRPCWCRCWWGCGHDWKRRHGFRGWQFHGRSSSHGRNGRGAIQRVRQRVLRDSDGIARALSVRLRVHDRVHDRDVHGRLGVRTRLRVSGSGQRWHRGRSERAVLWRPLVLAGRGLPG